MKQNSFALLTNGDLSQATLTSPVVDLTNIFGYSVQSTTTGSGVGNLAIQVSNDNPNGVPQDNFTAQVVNWTTFNTSPIAAPGTLTVNVSDCFYKWLRVVYTKTSGTGTISSILQAKGV